MSIKYCPRCGGSGDDYRRAKGGMGIPFLRHSNGLCPDCSGSGLLEDAQKNVLSRFYRKPDE